VRFGSPKPDVVVKMLKSKVMGGDVCEFRAFLKD
jgi:hypothetical protein